MKKEQRRFFMKTGLLMSVLILLVGVYFAYPTYMDMRREGEGQVDKTVTYPLRKNASAYQKQLHEEMMHAIENKNYEKASGLLAESFVADFYTWTNKDRITDVGGLQYLSKPLRSWVYDLALETNYQDFAYLLSKNQVKHSLEVVKTNSRVEKDQIFYENKKQDAYRVYLDWDYADSDHLNLDVYPRNAIATVILDEEDLLSIVEVLYETEN